MDISDYRNEIKLKMTGGILDLELDDQKIDLIIQSAFREIQRYIETSTIITIPYSRCIDLSEYNVSSIAGVYRANPIADSGQTGTTVGDPMQAMQWQMLSGTGVPYNFTDYMYNYGSYQTMLQIRNTLSTDLSYWYDKIHNKLYVNVTDGTIDKVTIEYIPYFKDVSEIVSDFWIDKIMKLALALTKVTVGRIRSKFTQSNALWQNDGATLLQEGNAELEKIRDDLQKNAALMYIID